MSIKQTKTNHSHVCMGVQRSTFNPQPLVHCWDSEGYHWRPCACQRLWYPEGPRWSGLVVMVKVMFINESSGCCHHVSCMSCAMALHRRGRCRAFNCCLTPILLHAHRRSPALTSRSPCPTVRRLPVLLQAVLNGCNQFYNEF